MQFRLLLSSLIIIFLYTQCTNNLDPTLPYASNKASQGASAMVVSPHPLASQVGLDILKQGGNAVDAAIAVQFAMAVVYPRAGNIGGGGFMVIRTKDGTTDALDYRERAPLEADRDMYLDESGEVIPKLSTIGHLASGVPGTVDGMVTAHARYGKLEWEKLLDPAIKLAAEGFNLSQAEVDRLTNFQEAFQTVNEGPNPFIKEEWTFAEQLLQPDLAQTLERIKERKRAGFYEGSTADFIVKEMKRGGGLISHQDLKEYKSTWRLPIIENYKDYRIISMPPSSSGGVALVQLLKMIEPYPISNWGFQDPRTIHLMVEAERRAYADRAEHLGDSDYYDVPIQQLLDEAYLAERMGDFTLEQASKSDSLEAGQVTVAVESFETTHTSIIDAEGNAVSVTTTLNSNYGSKVWVPEAGFFLNNEMDDFSIKPGVPNQFGLVGAEANAIAPQKRMLSSMTPTIIEKDGAVFMVLGSPGGSTIITAVFQVFLNVAEFGMDLPAAVEASRFHHQWLPDMILYEEGGLDSMTIKKLESLGHQFLTRKRMAVVKAIHRLPDGTLQGAADPRNPDDDARGY